MLSNKKIIYLQKWLCNVVSSLFFIHTKVAVALATCTFVQVFFAELKHILFNKLS